MAAKYFSDLFKLTSPTDFEIFLDKMSTLVTYNQNTIFTSLVRKRGRIGRFRAGEVLGGEAPPRLWYIRSKTR